MLVFDRAFTRRLVALLPHPPVCQAVGGTQTCQDRFVQSVDLELRLGIVPVSFWSRPGEQESQTGAPAGVDFTIIRRPLVDTSPRMRRNAWFSRQRIEDKSLHRDDSAPEMLRCRSKSERTRTRATRVRGGRNGGGRSGMRARGDAMAHKQTPSDSMTRSCGRDGTGRDGSGRGETEPLAQKRRYEKGLGRLCKVARACRVLVVCCMPSPTVG